MYTIIIIMIILCINSCNFVTNDVMNDTQPVKKRIDSVVTLFFCKKFTHTALVRRNPGFKFMKFFVKFIFFPRTYTNQYLIRGGGEMAKKGSALELAKT